MEQFGCAGYTLMERAGNAVFEHYRGRWPLVRKVLILAGPGNNGGDGYVIAKLARAQGHNVSVVGFGEPAAGGDAARHRREWLDGGGSVLPAQEIPEPVAFLQQFELVIDAMLGTGLTRAPGEPLAGWVAAVNRCGVPVIAVDVPTGLDSDRGVAIGEAVHAAATVTFIGRKQGLFTHQGVAFAGEVTFDRLGVPAEVYDQVPPSAHLIVAGGSAQPALPPRWQHQHKGDNGHLLLIAGGPGMAGAAIIAGRAALRAGCGLVTAAVHPQNAAAVVNACPEMMVHGVADPQELTKLLQRADVVAIGPGLGLTEWSQGVWDAVSRFDSAMVVDADGLNLLAHNPGHCDSRIITPHPGEAGRLLNRDTAAVQVDRFAAVTELTGQYGGVALLKGAGTLIAAEGASPTIIQGGNPGMAAPGMGDALTGVVGAFLAQGLDLQNSAKIGAALHAWAGDRAAAKIGQRGLMASDLIENLPPVINGTNPV